MRRSALVFFLLLLGTLARADAPLTVAFPDASTYTVWAQSPDGRVTFQPMTITGVRTFIVPPPAIHPGDTVFVKQGATGLVAVHPAPEHGTLVVAPGDFHVLKLSHAPRAGTALLAWTLGLLLLAGTAWYVLRGRLPRAPVAAHDAPPAAPAADLETLEDGRFPHLFGTQGLAAGTMFSLTRPVMTVGRDGDRDLVLADETVSRHHARLTRGPNGQTVLSDEGSANGTQVNGRRVKQAVLSAGDEIQIGDSVFLFQK